jgi:hypothetical protein
MVKNHTKCWFVDLASKQLLDKDRIKQGCSRRSRHIFQHYYLQVPTYSPPADHYPCPAIGLRPPFAIYCWLFAALRTSGYQAVCCYFLPSRNSSIASFLLWLVTMHILLSPDSREVQSADLHDFAVRLLI